MRCGPDCRYGSAYPPSLSVKADLLAWQPSANCGLMHCSKIYTPPSFARKLLQTSFRRAAKSVFRLDFRFQAAEVFLNYTEMDPSRCRSTSNGRAIWSVRTADSISTMRI
jgi:hypothetical protein